jgi:hypothetical protein
MGLMGYITAGAISGAGQAIQQGAQQTQSAFTQQMLIQEREKLEAARDEKMREFQRSENALNRELESRKVGIQESEAAANTKNRELLLTQAIRQTELATRTLEQKGLEREETAAYHKQILAANTAEHELAEKARVAEAAWRAEEKRANAEGRLADTQYRTAMAEAQKTHYRALEKKEDAQTALLKEQIALAMEKAKHDMTPQQKSMTEAILKQMDASIATIKDAASSEEDKRQAFAKIAASTEQINALFVARPNAKAPSPNAKEFQQPPDAEIFKPPARETAPPADSGASALMGTTAPEDPAIAQAREIRRSLPAERKTLMGRGLEAIINESGRQLQPAGPSPITPHDVGEFIKRADHPGFAEAFRRKHGRVPTKAELDEYRNALRR